MGYPHSESTSLDAYSARFCGHVLRIEISGAEIQNLRIVDLPGLVHSKCLKGLSSTFHADSLAQ